MMQPPYRTSGPRSAAPPDQPRAEPVERQQAETAGQAGAGSGILIVEDDFLIAMQAEIALVDAGFSVVGVAAAADEALVLARERRPAIAVVDIRVAGPRDGIDAAGDLFRELGVRSVFATAHDDQQTRARAEPFAPLGWLTKPYTMASLINVIRAALSKPN
ncbi:response regulator [Bradyrhizobium sp.]|uniref:response regulator n=1 Tax=Bradyrhizobium sp. TaxID=376 RepID=UPI0025BA2808|nr:response regulator [Bradyrhizobium sp.]